MNNKANLNLFSYQSDWIKDKSRFKIGLWSRQTGKDFTCAQSERRELGIAMARQQIVFPAPYGSII